MRLAVGKSVNQRVLEGAAIMAFGRREVAIVTAPAILSAVGHVDRVLAQSPPCGARAESTVAPESSIGSAGHDTLPAVKTPRTVDVLGEGRDVVGRAGPSTISSAVAWTNRHLHDGDAVARGSSALVF